MQGIPKKFSLRTLSAVTLLIGIVVAVVLQDMRMRHVEERAVARQSEHLSEIERLEKTIASQEKRIAENQRHLTHKLRSTETPWAKSEDLKVLARLVPEFDRLPAGQPIRVLLEVKNGTDQPLTIDSSNFPYFITLTLDGRQVRFVGPVPCVPPPEPIFLLPGGITGEEYEFTIKHYPGLAEKGAFEVSFTYRSATSSPQSWNGEIPLSASWINE